MIRPILSRLAVRLVIAAVLALLWDRFVNTAGLYDVRSHVFPVLGAIFLILAWFHFLRIDGVTLLNPRRQQKEKKPSTGSMMDAVDTEPEKDEDLLREERDFCALAASLLSGIFCLLFGLL